MRKWTQEMREDLVRRHDAGDTFKIIGAAYGVTASRVADLCHRERQRIERPACEIDDLSVRAANILRNNAELSRHREITRAHVRVIWPNRQVLADHLMLAPNCGLKTTDEIWRWAFASQTED